MHKLLLTASVFTVMSVPVWAQTCGSIPQAAKNAGYTTQTMGGPITVGQGWTGSAGDGVTQNSDGSVTIAAPTNNHYNAQLASAISVGGGAYIQGTLQALGPVTTNGGWPSIWLYDHEQRSTDRAEVDIAEVYGGVYGSALHDWNGPPGMPMSSATNTNLPQIPVDLSQPTTFGVLLKPGSAQFYLNGNPVGPITTWNSGGPFSITDQSHLTIALGTGQTPVRFSNVQVWQNPTTANDVGISSVGTIASGCATSAALSTPAPSTPIPSSEASVAVIVPGQGSIADSNGNAWSISGDGQVIDNGQLIPGGGQTSAVEVVNGIVWGHDNGKGPVCPGCWFTLGSGGWVQHPGETPPDQTPLPPTQPSSYASVCTSATPNYAATSGGFATLNGQIYNPNGTPFVARGLNVYSDQLADASANLTNEFSGVNFIRVIMRNYASPASLQSFVNQMTAQGIVVEFEDHPDGGGGQDAGPPGGIATESAWYASLASTFKTNPYVWFGTFNEPMATSGLSAWQQATYQAIRGAGNNSPILLEVSGSRPWNLQQALDPSVYATMTNVVWDVHAYNYQSNYSADQATVDASVQGMISAAQKITSADGTVPVIIGEYGNSTTGGVASDPGGTQEVKAVENSGVGSAAFTFTKGIAPGNMLRNNDGSLTAYGQMTAAFTKTGGTPTGCAQSPIPVATAPPLQTDTTQTAPELAPTSITPTAPILQPNTMSVEQIAALAAKGG